MQLILENRYNYSEEFYKNSKEALEIALETAPLYQAWRTCDPGPKTSLVSPLASTLAGALFVQQSTLAILATAIAGLAGVVALAIVLRRQYLWKERAVS
jgi:hypothetical protein